MPIVDCLFGITIKFSFRSYFHFVCVCIHVLFFVILEKSHNLSCYFLFFFLLIVFFFGMFLIEGIS